MKPLTILSIAIAGLIGLSAFSCKKKNPQLREFYRNQDRDHNVTALYRLYDPQDSGTATMWEFRDSGEIERYMVKDGQTYKAPGYYWYTKDGKLHKLFYPGSWDKGTYEETAEYRLSAGKDTLYLREDYSSLISIFLRQ